MQPVVDRVKHGAAFFDEHMPDWYTKIDVGILDIAHPNHCIGGQLEWPFGTDNGELARSLGMLDYYENKSLTYLWKEQIQLRKENGHGLS